MRNIHAVVMTYQVFSSIQWVPSSPHSVTDYCRLLSQELNQNSENTFTTIKKLRSIEASQGSSRGKQNVC